MTCIREGNTYKRHNYCKGVCKGCGKEQPMNIAQDVELYGDHISAAEEGDGHEQIPAIE